MTERAVGGRTGSDSSGRFGRGVVQARFILVTDAAASGRYRADRAAVQIMALSTAKALLPDVKLMAVGSARRLPGELHTQ